MLKLHKSYSILSSIRVTKKLTQQYIVSFRIIERVACLVYKLKVPSNQKIYPIFSIAQLKPAPSLAKDPFQHSRLQNSPQCLWKVILIVTNLLKLSAFLINMQSKNVKVLLSNTLYGEPGMAYNGIGGIISRFLTMLPTLFKPIKKA